MKKKINLLLRENVEELGLIGDEVSVSLGYAKNFLIPKKLVLTKNDPAYREIIKQVKGKRLQIEKELGELKKESAKLVGKILTFTRKVSSGGKLFGSVTPEDIADEIKIDKKYVESEPLKSIGEHSVKIKLPQNVESQIIVVIKAEKSLDKARDEDNKK